MRIFIVRHGQTEKNRTNLLQGRSDVPLNDVGRQQAEELGERLRAAGIGFDRVYTSPLIRAMQTAELIAGGAPQTVEERLIEMDYGPYEGMSLKDPDPEIRRFFSDFVHQPAPAGMEALADVTARLYENIIDEEKGVYNEDGSLNLNPNSLTVVEDAVIEPCVKDAKAYDSFQFVRNGYYCVDAKDSAPGQPVFNRIVSMKSSFKLPK